MAQDCQLEPAIHLHPLQTPNLPTLHTFLTEPPAEPASIPSLQKDFTYMLHLEPPFVL